MMTDIAVPLTVRRLVAFSRAVYEGEAVVEDMTARLAKNQEEAEEIMEQGDIPVIVDPKAECIQWFQPDVIVDAILAKRNLEQRSQMHHLFDRSRTWIYCWRRL